VLARPLPVSVFYGEGDGEVATVGTVAEIREVFSRVQGAFILLLRRYSGGMKTLFRRSQ
jgi:hypothetical protein